MKVIAVNGSPRKTWNTATLLQKALEGAASQGTETELIHLYDLNFKGCGSCFGCKTKGGKSYGKCAMKDELTPLLKRIDEEDVALILGSPIYFGGVTGEMKSFMERLLFAYLVYSHPPGTVCPHQIQTGLIYTMNCPEAAIQQVNYDKYFSTNEWMVGRILGPCESLCSYETLQFEDYSKVVADWMDPQQRMQRHKEVFPVDCQKAFELGARIAKGEIAAGAKA